MASSGKGDKKQGKKKEKKGGGGGGGGGTQQHEVSNNIRSKVNVSPHISEPALPCHVERRRDLQERGRGRNSTVTYFHQLL